MREPGVILKRVYEPPAADDGTRILVDRLWPRGLAKADAAIDFWMKELGPSTTLRKWFNHDPARWDEFRQRYLAELKGDEPLRLIGEVRRLAAAGGVSLLYAAKDGEHNNAVVLAEVLAPVAGAGSSP